jgi:hypothetical protein
MLKQYLLLIFFQKNIKCSKYYLKNYLSVLTQVRLKVKEMKKLIELIRKKRSVVFTN